MKIETKYTITLTQREAECLKIVLLQQSRDSGHKMGLSDIDCKLLSGIQRWLPDEDCDKAEIARDFLNEGQHERIT